MRKIYLLLLAAFSIVYAKAQNASTYAFSASIGTYTQINDATATLLPLVKADTYISPAQNIGFDFVYEGITYTQFKMSSNGLISLNMTGTSSLTGNDFSTANATSRPIIAPLWDDLDGRTTGDLSVAGYEVTGVAPNRVLTVEWRNWEWDFSSSNPVLSFQVKLYETTGIIQFIYRQESGVVVPGSASIGIGSATGSGNNSYLNVTSVSVPAVSSTSSVTNITTKPANNQVFTFSPPSNELMNYVNLQHPGTATIPFGGSETIYTQGYEPGVTEAPGAGTGVQAWIGYSTTNTNPNTWTNWVPATFNVQVGNNDEFSVGIGSTLAQGTYYYASRWRLGTGLYSYGGFNSGGGDGFWDGTNDISGVLTVNPPLPPANNECSGAISLTAGATSTCSGQTAGTTVSATQSTETAPSCGATGVNDDVWYSFVATAAEHTVTLSNVSGSTDMAMAVYSGSCGALTQLVCSDPNVVIISGLTVGQTYYVRVWTYTATTTTTATFDICITTPPAMAYVSSTTTQSSTANVVQGSFNQQIIRTAVVVSGAGNPIAVTQIDYTTNGSTNAATDIANAKVYYTGSSTTFSTTAPFGSVVAGPNGSFSVTGSQALAGGTTNTTNYFWLVYDIAPAAVVANVVDATCQSVVVGSAQTPTATNPTGTRPIIAALVNDEAPGAIELTVNGTCTGATYTNIDATLSPNESKISCKGSQTAGNQVWFKFVAPASGFVKVSTDISGGSLTDTRMGLFSATNVNDYATFTIISCDDDNGSTVANSSTLYANGLTAGATYYIAVDHWNGAGTGTFCIEVRDVTGAMISTGTSCTAGQDLASYNQSYTGWLSITDNSGNLRALVRNTAGGTGTFTYNNSLTINAGAVRQSPSTGTYYLDRNYRIANTAATNVEVRFFFLASELAALNTADGTTLGTLAVTRQVETVSGCQSNYLPANGAVSLLPQTANGASTDGTVNWIQVTTPGFSNFYLNNVGQVLPIAIEYFRGTKQNSRNVLDWKVSCYNSPSVTLILQRSSDGRQFKDISTTTESATRCLQPFNYNDLSPLAGINYYRLKSIDVDRKVSYSNVVALLNKDKGFEIVSLAPNPVQDEAILSVTSAEKTIMEIVVSDLNGKQISKQRVSLIAGNNQLPLNLRNVAAGTYQVTGLTADGLSRTLRFVKQ